MSRSSHRTEILVRVRVERGRSIAKRKPRKMSQTFEHRVADIIMCADVTPRISDGVEESVGSGQTGGDAEEIRGGGGERADGFLVVHEELENGQDPKPEDGLKSAAP